MLTVVFVVVVVVVLVIYIYIHTRESGEIDVVEVVAVVMVR